MSDKMRIWQCACTVGRTHLGHGEMTACGMDEKISKRRLTFVKKRSIMQSGKDKGCFYSYKNKGGNHDEDGRYGGLDCHV